MQAAGSPYRCLLILVSGYAIVHTSCLGRFLPTLTPARSPFVSVRREWISTRLGWP